MPDISKITLPSGNTYDIKDAGARELISALQSRTDFLGVSLTELSDGDTTNPISIDGVTGTVTAINGNTVAYGNAEFIWDGSKWREFGDLSNLGALAYKSTVSLIRGSGDQVLGEATTFTAASSAVSFSGGTTETFVKSVSAETNKKLVTTTVPNVTGNSDVTIPNVTSVGAASTWGFAMGTGNDAETLIISGANGTAPTLGTALSASKVTLGTAKTVATGATATNGAGDAVVTGVTVGESASAVTSIGTATAAAQAITVGTNDKVKVAKWDDLSVSAS